MILNSIENSQNSSLMQKQPPTQDALRRAATQFEAILLMQLTSVLNGSKSEGLDGEEDSLFGSDGGSGLAKQMFSEQLATTMAEAGGTGMSDMILQQMGIGVAKSSGGKTGLAGVMSAMKEIKNTTVTKLVRDNKISPLINTSGRIKPLKETFAGNPNDAEIVSTFDGSFKNSDTTQTLQINGKIIPPPASQFMPGLAEDTNISMPTAVGSTKNVENTKLQIPVNGRISSNFGNRFHPIDKVTKFHAGLDIAAQKGSPIGAAADGIVTFAGPQKGYGNLVVVKHPDGKETRYGHTDKIFVAQGEQVSAGQTIATVGSTGKSTGPHVHFEVRENGQAVNPRNFLTNVLKK